MCRPSSILLHLSLIRSTRTTTTMASQNRNFETPMYPEIDTTDLAQNLFPENDETTYDPNPNSPSAPPQPLEETLLTLPGSILHLIDNHFSVELSAGDFSVHRLLQGQNTVAVLARVNGETQWPLTKDVASVKLDSSHYFFSFRSPKQSDSDSDSDPDPDSDGIAKNPDQEKHDVLNYGLTILSKGQEGLLRELDVILDTYSGFSVHEVEEKGVVVVDVAKEVDPAELDSDEKKVVLEGKCAAYWTTLAPNVEEYSGSVSKLIAAGSGQLVKGILWCGDVTVDRLNWANEVMKKRTCAGERAEISPQTLQRIKRVKRVTKMTEKVAGGVLSGVVKVSGFFTRPVANSKVGKKVFGLLPGEMVLASLDGFSKICDAVEIAGKNVMSTSSTVTTGLVCHRYGEEAAKATSEGLDAAGHAVGTAWAVFKIRKAFNPKSVLKPSSLAKSAAKVAVAGKKSSK